MRKSRAAAVFATITGLLAVTAAAALMLSSKAPPEGLPRFDDPLPDEDLANALVAAMTDSELLAQTLMFGWAGTDPSPLVTDWVAERGLGSIKIFGWNTDDTRKVAESVTALQKKAAEGRFGIPLFVATDQEGGWIRHIKGRTTETPGNLAIGASGLPADAWNTGYYISRELGALGINLNFAPAVDLYTDHESTVIGPRSFGEDPDAAGILGAAFVAGSRAAGVLTTAKHFPGHGDTGMDSHGKLPVIPIDGKTFRSRELVPFRYLIDAGVEAVMSGHLNFPQITGNDEPATFSKLLLNDVLRDEMGFTGLIVTDDIMMNGATEYAGSVSRAVQLALEAGNDIIESSTTPSFGDAFWAKNLDRMSRVPAFRDRVKDAARRVILAKLSYFKDDDAVPVYPDLAKLEERVPDPEGKEFFLSQAVRSVTLVRNAGLPLGEPGRVLLASAFPSFLEAGTARFPGAETSGVNWNLPKRARAFDTVIFCLSSREQLPVLNALRGEKCRVIVVSALSPVLLENAPWVNTALAVYSYAPLSFTAAFGALAGDFTPEGIMPLKGIN